METQLGQNGRELGKLPNPTKLIAELEAPDSADDRKTQANSDDTTFSVANGKEPVPGLFDEVCGRLMDLDETARKRFKATE